MNMKCDNSEEMFPVVDEQGNILGAATRGECHGGSRLLHPVVHLHVFNSQGDLYLQRRPLWKDIQPGRWDTAVGGHVDLGESVDMALRREAREELGLEGFVPEPLDTYVFESARERELVYTFRTTWDGPVCPSDELDGGRFWTPDEIRQQLGKGVFTPNFESELRRVARMVCCVKLFLNLDARYSRCVNTVDNKLVFSAYMLHFLPLKGSRMLKGVRPRTERRAAGLTLVPAVGHS